MRTKEYRITYVFTSTKPDGNDYTRTITIDAVSLRGAESAARREGFKEFGARFNDNCFDWHVEAA